MPESGSPPAFQPSDGGKVLTDVVAVEGVSDAGRVPGVEVEGGVGLRLSSRSADGHGYLLCLDADAARRLVAELQRRLAEPAGVGDELEAEGGLPQQENPEG